MDFATTNAVNLIKSGLILAGRSPFDGIGGPEAEPYRQMLSD